jgi:hypothetical protein
MVEPLKYKNDPYYDPKYKGTYYGNGLYGPDPYEDRQNNNWKTIPVWVGLLILCCSNP